MTLATTRDMQHGVIGGVCAGIAARYRFPVPVVRAATVAISVGTAGIGGLAYVALWRFLPATAGDETTDAPIAQIPRPRAFEDAEALGVAEATARTAHLAPSVVTATRPRTDAPPIAPELYGPVAADLPLVREQMLAVAANVEFEFLRKMIEQALSGTGKMMRPAIALLAGRVGDAGYPIERLVPLAASVELLHTATLVHDDVIDEAAERRGKPTSAALFGNAASVMLGDYMFAHAADFIARTDSTVVVRKFAQTLMLMANGELTQDMTVFQYSEDVQRYLDRIIGKTASLFGTAAEGGAIVGGATPEQCEAMRLFGLRLGIAFQIVDDILDFTGDAEVMGKPVGSDLQSGTLTLPAILYMRRNPDDNPVKKAFEGIRPRANFERAIREIQESDVLAQSMETARNFAGEAKQALAVLPPGEERTTLEGLVEYVLARES
ncbi:MAG: polyprenyl synthetase family protein [Chloroflexi bacterium]|nr:polyprenyl synthetase family protein [Chloroflexota bacterium]